MAPEEIYDKLINHKIITQNTNVTVKKADFKGKLYMIDDDFDRLFNDLKKRTANHPIINNHQ